MGFAIAAPDLSAIEEVLTGKTWILDSRVDTYNAPSEEVYNDLCDEQLKITKPNNLELYCNDKPPKQAQWRLEASSLGDIVIIISNERQNEQRYILSFIKDGRIMLTKIRNGNTNEQLYRIYKEIKPQNP